MAGYDTGLHNLLRELYDDGLGSLIKLILGVFLLLLQRGHDVSVRTLFPVVQTVDLMRNKPQPLRTAEEVDAEGGGEPAQTNLVECNNERTLLLLQQVDGLDRLRLEAVHDVHHQDGDVTQRAASVPQVTAETDKTVGQDAKDRQEDELVRTEGQYLKDSCPGVSMISMPGILRFSLSNCTKSLCQQTVNAKGCFYLTE